MRRKQSTIYARLWVSVAVLVLVFAVASYLALSALSEVEERHQDSSHNMGLLHDALTLESDVRDQYIHQAHTIIIGNSSHLEHYEEAKALVTQSLQKIRSQLPREDLSQEIAQIDKAHQALDQIFYQQILPNVTAGDTARVREQHERAEALVDSIVQATTQLVASLEDEISKNDARAEEVEQGTYWRTLTLLASATLFALIVGAYLGRAIIGPIRRLEAGVAQMSKGDLSARVGVGADDELGNLAARFNEMAASLKEHQESLVRSEKLAGIGRLAAGVAHEINNPLGVILGYTKLLGKKVEHPSEELKVIEEEVSRCREIVQGLLDLSRPTKLHPQELDLSSLSQEVAERFIESGEISEGHLEIKGSAPPTQGDELRLRQVMLNLLRNAAEAAGRDGMISIHLERAEGQTLIRVKDNGPGISEDAKDKIFEPFFTTRPKGTGLGLAISRALVEAHGGQIKAENNPEGGACFTVSLPA